MRERVVLSRCGGYGAPELDAVIDGMFRDLGVYDELRPGMTAVLKPNLVLNSKPEEAIATHPAFVRAVGSCVQRAGAKVLIAESPGGPYTPPAMRAIFRGCGYTEMAEACGFSLYTDCASREVPLPGGVRCRRMAVAEPFLGADYLIDLAKLKTHSMVGFSGAVKNLFGTVPGLKKPELHCRFPEKEDFCGMLVDLCDFLQPDLCFLDGIWAMEGNGPTGGSRRDLHAVAASRSPYALDVCGASLAGLEPDSLPVLRVAAKRGLGPLSADELEISGNTIEELAQPDFRKAEASSTDFIDRLPRFLRPAAKKLATPYPRIDQKRCVGCGKCAESCPQHIISIKKKKAEIDTRNCIRCFCCHEMCPKHVVDIKRLGLFNF